MNYVKTGEKRATCFSCGAKVVVRGNRVLFPYGAPFTMPDGEEVQNAQVHECVRDGGEVKTNGEAP